MCLRRVQGQVGQDFPDERNRDGGLDIMGGRGPPEGITCQFKVVIVKRCSWPAPDNECEFK